MKRVLVLGCCGSGKSTFSRSLSTKSGLPIIHLDQHYFGPSWKEPNVEQWRKKVTKLCLPDHWIMDGNYAGTLDIRLPYADTVIYLDNGTLSNLYRVVKRIIKYHGKVRPDAADGCRERFDLEFLHYVLVFNYVRKPGILRRASAVSCELVVLKSSWERENYLETLGSW